MTSSRRPLDPDLYAEVVAEAKARFKVWPSAYASGWVVRTYKERGGRYVGGDRKTRSGLTKWFGESWVDLSRPIHDEDGELVGYEPCGRKASDDPAAYPKCRPLAEALRMSPSEVKDAIKRKRAAEAKAARGGRGGRGARAPVRVATYRGNPDTAFDWELPGTRGIREVTVDGVTVLYGYDGSSAHIASVRTKTKEQGQGKARRVLELFCAEADALGIPIRLEASPLTKKVNRARLVAFYESLGFEKTGRTINPAGDPEMVRLPRAATSRGNPELDTRALTGVPTFTPTAGEEPWELTLAELDRYQGSGPSSSLTRIAPPNQEPLPPIGTWRADPILRYVEQLQEIPIESIGFTEDVSDPAIRASVEAYIDYYLQGFEPLPASVVWNAPSQQLVTINRRRVLAAKLAGLSTVKAWVGGDKHEEVVERARAAGLATRANPLTDKGLIAIKAMRRAPEGSLLVSEDGGVAWRKAGPGRHNNGDWVRQKPSTTSPDGWKPTIGANGRPMPPDDWEQIKRFVMREGVTVVPPRD